jgi:hypothetical protein
MSIINQMPNTAIYAEKARELTPDELTAVISYCTMGTFGDSRYAQFFHWDVTFHQLGRKVFYWIKEGILNFCNLHLLGMYVKLEISDKGTFSTSHENETHCLVHITDENVSSLIQLMNFVNDKPTNVFYGDLLINEINSNFVTEEI